MGQELTPRGTIVPTERTERLAEINRVISECNLKAINGGGTVTPSGLEEIFSLAAGVQQLRDLITDDMMRDIMKLQGTPLGFVTDKDRNPDGTRGPGYPVEIIKDVTIEALMRGFRMVNNETNIIAGRFYGAKNGYLRNLREHPDLTDLDIAISVPKPAGDKGAIVVCVASWKIKTVPDSITRELGVKVNVGMGYDAIVGKATRKIAALAYGKLTGSEQSDGEVDDPDVSTLRRIDPNAPEAKTTGKSASEILQERLQTESAQAAEKTADTRKNEDRAAALIGEINTIVRGLGRDGLPTLKEVAGTTTLKGLTDAQLNDIVEKLKERVAPPPPAQPAAAANGSSSAAPAGGGGLSDL